MAFQNCVTLENDLARAKTDLRLLRRTSRTARGLTLAMLKDGGQTPHTPAYTARCSTPGRPLINSVGSGSADQPAMETWRLSPASNVRVRGRGWASKPGSSTLCSSLALR